MLKKIANLPVRALAYLAAKIMGRNTAPAADPPPPPPRRKPAPRPPAPQPEQGGGHDHGHDHGGGHDHGHDHGGAAEPAAAAPKQAPTDPPPAEVPAPKKAAKKVDVVAEETPNPNARKFTCSVQVVPSGSLSFASETEASAHPLGKAIWDVGGVKSVFAVKDFVTVTKTDEADWAKLVPKLTRAIKGAL